VRPRPDSSQPCAVNHPTLRSRVRGAHPGPALPCRCLSGSGVCTLLQRLSGQRGHSRLHFAGVGRSLRRSAPAAPRAESVPGHLLAGVLPHLRGQVPSCDAGRARVDSWRQAIHGGPGGDDSAAGGPGKPRQRASQDRHHRGGTGRIVVCLFPGSAGLPAQGLRGGAASGRDAGAGHSGVSAATRDRGAKCA
jgi:hypothetical protein